MEFTNINIWDYKEDLIDYLEININELGDYLEEVQEKLLDEISQDGVEILFQDGVKEAVLNGKSVKVVIEEFCEDGFNEYLQTNY